MARAHAEDSLHHRQSKALCLVTGVDAACATRRDLKRLCGYLRMALGVILLLR